MKMPFHKLMTRAGQLAFGNSAGIMNNLKGNAALARSRRSRWQPSIASTTSSAALVAAHIRNGFTELPCTYSPEQFARVREKFNRIIEDDAYSSFNLHKAHSKYSRRIMDVARTFREIAEVITPEVQAFVEERYQSYFAVTHIVASRHYHVPDELARTCDILTQFWHCDGHPTCTDKLNVNLSDVGEEDGPTQILTKAQTREAMRRGYRGRYDYRGAAAYLEREVEPYKCLGKAGSLFLTSTPACLHRQGVPAVGRQRDFVLMHFEPSATPLPPNWIDHVVDVRKMK